MNDKLTKRQEDILKFIYEYNSRYHYSPSIREIAKGLDLNSHYSTHANIEILIDKGFINRDGNKPRTLYVTEKARTII